MLGAGRTEAQKPHAVQKPLPKLASSNSLLQPMGAQQQRHLQLQLRALKIEEKSQRGTAAAREEQREDRG
jgi:hypothetical protein